MALSGAGCKKQDKPAEPAAELPGVFTNRANDKAYLGALTKSREEQKRLAAERAEVSKQMTALRERVKAKLPAGSDEAALKAALGSEPEWQVMVKRAGELEAHDRQALEAARATIRERMTKEAREAKSVTDGKARAVDGQAPQR